MKLTHLVRGLAFAAPNPLVRRNVRRNAWLPLGAAAAILFTASPALLAQASSGITGTVTDPTGAVIPGANIAIKSVATQTTTTVVSDSAGTYSVTGLVPGRYTITTTATGFSASVQNDVNVEVTVQATIDIHMVTGGSDQTVEVTANLIALNTTQPELGTTIEPTVVAALPVAVGGGRTRQIDQLQFLAPGTQGNTFSHQINGGVNFESEILYNGIPAPQSETAGYTTNFNPPFELVNEFRVERSTFSAKYGLAQGAVTYQTASGTNALHGDAFYINRNEFFDANSFSNPGGRTPSDRENDYGFTVGGPAVFPHLYNGKDKTFFLFSLDFAKTANTNTTTGTVPTALEKTGDFSDSTVPIFDPLTGRQFQYQGRLNVIDPARISPLSASIIPDIPNPDLGGLSGNKHYAPNAFPNVQHIWGFTVDHNINQNQSLHYAEWRNTFNTIGFDNAPIVQINNPLQSAKNNPAVGSVWLLNYVNTLTPKLVLTAGFAWVGEINNQFNENRHVNFGGVVPNYRGTVFPNITFDGTNAPTNWGTQSGWIQSINRKLGLAAVTNVLWTKGRNTFNIGGEARRSYQDDNECQACGGEFDFHAATTADPNNISGTGSSFASFLLGQVDAADRIFANELKLRNLLIAPYIQDDIKVTPKLTVNLGLRWDIMLPFKETKNQIVFLDPNNPNPAANNIPGIAAQFSNGNGGVNRANIDFKNFGPRIGAAYELNEKTVLQAGYNIAYLNGGSYEFGTSKVATQYGNLLQGSFRVSSNGGTTPAYGSWDARPLPAPPNQAVTPTIGFGTQINYFDPKRSGIPPYLQQWNFNVQRQLPWNTFLQVAYVGNRALRIPGQLNPLSQGNPGVLLPLGPLLNQSVNSPQAIARGITSPYPNFVNDLGSNATVAHALSPFPQYDYVYNNFDNTGAVAYNGLQTSVEKRFSNGLSFLTSFTLSRTMGNVDTAFGTFASLSENKYNLKPEYTVAGNDILNNAKISGTYELPIGPGKSFVNNKGITGQVLGGIQLGWITQYTTGTPFGISSSSANNPLGCANCFNRPNRVPGVAINTNGYEKLGLFVNGVSNRKVFTTSAFATTTGTYTLGNAQRNYAGLRNPGYYDEDIKAQKRFALGERVNFILEMNYFNLLNRVQHENPDGNVDDANYGLVTSNGQQNNPRQGQLSGRITF